MKGLRSCKIIALIIFLTAFLLTTIAQPSPPHRVYGDITYEGEGIANLSVYFSDGSQSYGSDTTASDGFYDIDISGANTGDKVYLFVENSNSTKDVTFTSGGSERLDHSGDYSPGDGSSGDNDTSSGDNTTDGGQDDTSGGSSGSSTDSTSSGGGGGGFTPPEDDSDSSPEPVVISRELSSDSSPVAVGSVEQGQEVSIQVSGSEIYLEGFSFVAQEDAENVSVILESYLEKPSETRKFDEGEAFRYYRIDLQGIEDFSDGKVLYSVSKSWLTSRNRSMNSVILESYDGNSWNRHGSEQVGEDFQVHSFEAATAVDGFFATGLTEQKEIVERADIEVSSFELKSSGEETVQLNISATVRNIGNAEGEKTIYLYRDSEIVDNRTVSLAPGEEEKLRFSKVVSEPGVYTYNIGEFREDVEVASSSNNFLLIAGGIIFVVITAILVIYVKESRRARKLDEQIQDIKRGGQRGKFQNSNQGQQNFNGNQNSQGGYRGDRRDDR